MKTLSLRLSDPLDSRLTSLARKRGQTKSAVVRDILEEFLGDNRKASSASCLDLAGDLVGCIQGPGDLSVNKKYMGGFGK